MSNLCCSGKLWIESWWRWLVHWFICSFCICTVEFFWPDFKNISGKKSKVKFTHKVSQKMKTHSKKQHIHMNESFFRREKFPLVVRKLVWENQWSGTNSSEEEMVDLSKPFKLNNHQLSISWVLSYQTSLKSMKGTQIKVEYRNETIHNINKKISWSEAFEHKTTFSFLKFGRVRFESNWVQEKICQRSFRWKLTSSTNPNHPNHLHTDKILLRNPLIRCRYCLSVCANCLLLTERSQIFFSLKIDVDGIFYYKNHETS